jgi:carotenoid cleavage dioxygenase-like enzyme
VQGELPADLCGAYLRNGPNPVFQPKNRYHPFDGDGMLHAVYFKDGQVSYRNRFVHTPAWREEQAAGLSNSPGVMGPFDYSVSAFGIKDTSNTDVFCYNGDIMSLWYNAGNPCRLDPLTLADKGPFALEGRAQRRMSAHSKVDWNSGELLFFDYGDELPYMTYGVADAGGRLRHEVAIELPGPRLPHDLGFTTNYTILHDLPFFHDPEVLQRHHLRVLTFHRDIPTRFGIIPRHGTGSEIRWFECEPCYILHVSNCWEEGDWVFMDGCRSTNPMPDAGSDGGELSHMLAYMRLEANAYRWRFNLKTGEVREGDIDDLNTEFNKSNPLFHGVKTRYSYHQRIPLLSEGGHTLRFTGLVKYNNDSGQYSQWEYGAGVFGSETVFAPKPGADRSSEEDDGYLLTLVTDSNSWTSECLVFDARDITRGPICRVQLPQRVPAGFHANWARGEDLWK